MDSKEFSQYIADNIDCDATTAQTVVDIFVNHLYLALAEGHHIDINSLGKFVVKEDTKTHTKYPSFSPAKDLKLACNY